MPGLFAAGDVRHGSVKRVAAAVGDGAMAVALVHRRLEEREQGPPRQCRRDPGDIGAPRFELGTSPTRTVRATRLRYAPEER